MGVKAELVSSEKPHGLGTFFTRQGVWSSTEAWLQA